MEDNANSPLKDQPDEIDMPSGYVKQTTNGLQDDYATEPPVVTRDYTCWSIFNILCCCFLFGIPALSYALTADTMIRTGNVHQARIYSRKSRTWNMLATIVGTITLAAFIIKEIILFIKTHNL